MTDLERELRDTLNERARLAPPPTDARLAIRVAHRRQIAVVLTAITVVALVAVGSTAGAMSLLRSSGHLMPANPSENPTGAPGTDPQQRSVTVTVSGIEGEAGSQMAVVVSGQAPGSLGGFAASVDSDSFSTTQVVRELGEGAWAGPYPYVSADVLNPKPGEAMLVLYLAPELRGEREVQGWPGVRGYRFPMGPAMTRGLKGCRMTFVVEQTGPTVVRIADPILADAPWRFGLPTCLPG